MTARDFRPGDPTEIRTAFDVWRPATAHSDTEPTHRDGKKIHDFPVVWVKVPGRQEALPWPAEDVRPYPQPEGDSR